MGIEYASGDEVTDNKHLAEAIDMTREGSAPPDGTTGYDDVENPHDDMVTTLRDSCFNVAIEELDNIDNAPADSQEKIDTVIRKLRDVWGDGPKRESIVMAECHGILQEIWVPPTE